MTVVQLSDKKSEPEIGSRAELEKLSAPSLALQLRDGPSATLSWLISQTSLNFAPGLFDKWPRGDGHPVLVVPGFLAGRASTQVLRRFLRRQGYFVHDWHGGRNLGIRHGMIDRLAGRLRECRGHLRTRTGAPTPRTRALRHHTGQSDSRQSEGSINLVAVFNAQYAHAATTRCARAGGSPPDRAASASADQLPVQSRRWCRCLATVYEPAGAKNRNIEVQATHLGLGNSLETLFVIADRLAQEEGSWRAFSPSPDDRPNPD